MADKLGELIVKLSADIKDMKAGLRSGLSEMSNFKSRAESLGSSIKSALEFAGVSVGIYEIGTALKKAFGEGIQAVDAFRLTTIGVAATLTDLGKEGSSTTVNYATNIAYARDMYNELELAAARHFATGKEMVEAWNILSQKGIVLRKDEIDSLGVIVDKIKLGTQGQASSIQIAQELRAMMSGQARATDQMAMMLRDRLGPEWENIVQKQREAGTLLTWLAEQFKGLDAANEDITNTLESQKATMTTLLTQIGREGLGGAYEDIVGWLKKGNEYLEKHKDVIANDISNAWTDIKPIVSGIFNVIVDSTKALKDFSAQFDEISANPLVGALWGAAAGSRAGPWGALAGSIVGIGYSINQSHGLDQSKSTKKERELYLQLQQEGNAFSQGMTTGSLTPSVKSFTPFMSEEDIKRLEKAKNLVIDLQNTWAKAFGSIGLVIQEWHNKELEKIQEVVQELASNNMTKDFADPMLNQLMALLSKATQEKAKIENLKANKELLSGPAFGDLQSRQKVITQDAQEQLIKYGNINEEAAKALAKTTSLAKDYNDIVKDPEVLKVLKEKAELYKIPLSLATSVMKNESNFNKQAKSPAGAYGLMQLMPGTAAGLGVDINDWQQNIEGGLKYLRQMFDMFGSTEKAIAAYNWGPGNLKNFLGSTTAPMNAANIPVDETRNYVTNVMKSAMTYSGLSKGPIAIEEQGPIDAATAAQAKLNDAKMRGMVIENQTVKTIQSKIEYDNASLEKQKSIADTLASQSPLIADQIKYKQESFGYEKQIAEKQLEQFFIKQGIKEEDQQKPYRDAFEAAYKLKEEDMQRLNILKQITLQTTISSQFKGYLSDLQGNVTNLKEQLSIKGKILALDIQESQSSFQKFLLDNGANITQELRTQLSILLEQLNTAKAFALQRENWQLEGFSGGMKAGAFERTQSAQTYDFNFAKSIWTDVESTLSSALNNAFVSAAKTGKVVFEDIGWAIADAFVNKMVTYTVGKLVNSIAELFSGPAITLQTTAESAALTLSEGGVNAGIAILNAANAAAVTLSTGQQNSGSGLFSSIIGKIFGNTSSSTVSTEAGYGWAKGGIFQTFARGGLVTGPTIFPMATGLGLMGEAGYEAVMPLTRLSGGDLGVKASLGQSQVTNITVNNNAKNTNASAETQSNGDIIVTIDELMAQANNRGGKFHKSLQTIQGIGIKSTRR